MLFHNVVDDVLPESTDEDAIEHANGICEYNTHSATIAYAKYVATVNGLDVYYDYGGDYHFFVVSEDDEEDLYDDSTADADTFASIGWGTDEDYGYYGDDY